MNAYTKLVHEIPQKPPRVTWCRWRVILALLFFSFSIVLLLAQQTETNTSKFVIVGSPAIDEPRTRFEEAKVKAENGDAEAQYALGDMYRYGDGVSEDETEGVKWYRKSADQNYGNAQDTLGYCYKHGIGVSKDLPESLSGMAKAAESVDNLAPAPKKRHIGITNAAIGLIVLIRKTPFLTVIATD